MKKPTASELEQYIVAYNDLDVPYEALEIYKTETKDGVPTAIAKHPTHGWFVIQTFDQSPYIIWEEKI